MFSNKFSLKVIYFKGEHFNWLRLKKKKDYRVYYIVHYLHLSKMTNYLKR